MIIFPSEKFLEIQLLGFLFSFLGGGEKVYELGGREGKGLRQTLGSLPDPGLDPMTRRPSTGLKSRVGCSTDSAILVPPNFIDF